MIKTICVVLIFVAVAFAGWERAIYSQSTSCSGEVDTTQVDDNKCGKSLNSNNYYIIFYDSGNKRYQIEGYGSDSACSRKLTTTTIDQDNLGKCIPLSSFGSISVGSQMIKFWVACFPGEATVEVEGGHTVTLDQLKVGQKIASYRKGSSTPIYSEVYSFLDFDPNMSIQYRKIEFVGENNITGSISVSYDHLLLAKRTGSENFYYAKEIEVGDTIFHNQKGSVVPVLVSAISNKVSKGVYAPATMEGTVIVDGVVASSYASVDHSIGHAILAPLRWAYWLSPSLVKTDVHGLHPYTQTFYNWFSQFLMNPHSFIAPYSIASN